MLVLSRKLKEKIVLPTLGTAVQVLEIKRGTVRLGIEAPPEVTVLREEVPDRAAGRQTTKSSSCQEEAAGEGTREPFLRSLGARLTTTAVGLGLLRLQLDAGLIDEASASLLRIQDDLQWLRYGVEGEAGTASAKPPSRPRKQKALLVEDNRNERELLAAFLRQWGLHVDTADDGSDALEYLRCHGKPDVVLLDMALPRVDGPTVVRELRRDEAYSGLKIFGVTGHLPEEFHLDRGPCGIDRWFLKPIDPGALRHELLDALDGSRSGM